MNPLVSITLTSYNQKIKLERAFNSLINQTYKNIEIIIVDDCSTDGVSQNYIKSLCENYPDTVRCYFQQENVGIPRNKNTGLKMSNGQYITYLDGDDFYYPNKIEKEIEKFNLNPEIDVVYSNFDYFSGESESLNLWKTEEDEVHEGNILKYIISRSFPRYTLYRFELIKSYVLKRINYFDESLFAFEDWDSRIRYSSFCNVGYCNNVGSSYVVDGSGISKRTNTVDLALQMKKVFLNNIDLLDDEVTKDEKKHIVNSFLTANYNHILSSIDIKKRPILYLKISIMLRLLIRNLVCFS